MTASRSADLMIAAIVMAALGSSPAPAQSTAPPFPVGTLAAYPAIVQTGIRPILEWSISYPSPVNPQSAYVNFIRQIQYPSGVTRDAQVPSSGQQLSALPIDPGSAKFELWTVDTNTLVNYLLDTTYVGTYVPMASVVIRSEDPYGLIPRTRADRPFHVDVTVSGLLSGESYPVASKSVKLLRQVQSYGVSGTGADLDRTQATLLSQASITTNGTQTLTYAVNSVPGPDRTKVRGEERFSVFSVADYQAPECQIASKFIQIWPVADGAIAGLTQGQIIRETMPQITFTLNDLYPSSTSYAQVYKGNPQLGVRGTVVPGTSIVVNQSTPSSHILTVDNSDSVFDSDGLWTMELLTETPFGTDRLAVVSFTLDRTADNPSPLLVTGNNTSIPDGDATPGPANHTDFGSVAAGGGTVVRTFSIQNTGNQPLNLSGTPKVAVSGTHATDFTVTRQPASPVAVGDSTTFEVTFAPGAAWLRGATLTIAKDTPDANPYDFAIQGTGITQESWRQAYFGSIDNRGDGADLNDFDKDGLPNLIEFAFDLNPKQNSAGQVPAPQKAGNNYVISFTQPAGVSGIAYGAEWSTALLPDSWIPVADTGTPPQHTFSVPIDTKPKLYMRLKVTGP